jgi:hypothetical protein
MPASGFPLGVYPAGLGGPTTAPDAPSGPPVIARYIDPLTGDYELDASTGQYTGMPPVRQLVEIALGSVARALWRRTSAQRSRRSSTRPL